MQPNTPAGTGRVGRPPLPVGTAGKIGFSDVGDGVRARAKFRDADGVVRPVTRSGPTRAAAERLLKEALRDRQTPLAGGDITPHSRFRDAAALWLAEIDTAGLAAGSVDTYRRNLHGHVLPALGDLEIREITVGTVDRLLKTIRARYGPGAAKNCKTVTSLVLGLAVRHDALPANPVRDVAKIRRGKRSAARALTVEGTKDLLKRVTSMAGEGELVRHGDEQDLPDLCQFMLGTGVRVGEALAVRDDVIDLDAGVVEINATIVRITGKGSVLQERAKTDAGWRVIAVPDHIVELMRTRMQTPQPVIGEAWVLSPDDDYRQVPAHELGLVFPTVAGGVRNTSNVQRGLRAVTSRIGDYGWVRTHTFRKTVATRLDEAGLSAREIADHLGHARPSMTLDVYMGRGVASAEAAKVLRSP